MEREPDEKLYAFLERRERELIHQIAALKGEIEPRENELAHVQSAKRQINLLGENDAARFGKPSQVATEGAGAKERVAAAFETFAQSMKALDSRLRGTAQFTRLTIKELILKALNDHFPKGATAIELLTFIRDAYARDIERSSLTPQLSRLRNEGLVDYIERGDETITRFVVARSFNSTVRRFPVGTVITIPDDEKDLERLKSELAPRKLEDLKSRQWIVVPSGGGFWRLARPLSTEPGEDD
jgi:hypothetical protein